MSEDLYGVPSGEIHSRDEVRHRAAARNAEIDGLLAAGVSDDQAAAFVTDAVAAHEADNAAYAASVKAGTAVLKTGRGTPRLEVVESLLGTPMGDENAHAYGLHTGELSIEQIQVMRRNGTSYAEIANRIKGRHNIVPI